MRVINVMHVIEKDEGLVLFGGEDADTGEKVTFHSAGPGARKMAEKIEAGEIIHAELEQ